MSQDSSRFQDPYAYLAGELNSTDVRGLKCELKSYDARYNSQGEFVVLDSGTRHELNPPEVNEESALVLTKFYTKRGDLDATELLVRSPHLTLALRTVIFDYPGINLDAREIAIRGLPECLFHYRVELASYGHTLRDQTAIRHLTLLLNHVRKIFETQMMTYSSLMESPQGLPLVSPGLNFENLWMAFRPGCFIYAQASEAHSVMRLKYIYMHEHEDYRRTGWDVTGEYITYDGKDYGYKDKDFFIPRYEGYRSLKQFEICPLQFFPGSAGIKRELIARGQKFVMLRGVHYMSYHGVAQALAPFRNTGMLGEQDKFPLRTTPVRIRTYLVL